MTTLDLRAELADRYARRAEVAKPKPRRYPTPADVARRDPAWQMSPALALINAALTELMDDPATDALEVTMPPQEGKSTLCARHFPKWVLDHVPGTRVAIVSYEKETATRWGREIRQDVLMAGDALNIQIRRDSQAAGRWQTPQGGGVYCVGIGGALAGQPVDLLIIDDPVKDHEQAESSVYREAAWNWWETVALTRLAPGAKVLLILTRWHQDDLAGRIESRPSSLRWRRIKLPAIAGESDPLGRAPGAEFPSARARKPGYFARLKATMSAYVFSALYQQEPTAAEGNFFRRATFHYWQRAEPWSDGRERLSLDGRIETLTDCWRFMTMDVAASTKTTADYTVIAMWAVPASGDLILLDRVRARVPTSDHFSIAAPLLERWGQATVYVERQFYSQTFVSDARNAGWGVAEVVADTDKITRAIPASGRVHAGKVWWPAKAAWLEEWEDEIATFPKATHDDQVDTLSYAARVLIHSWTPPPGGQPPAPAPPDPIGEAHAAATGNGHRELDMLNTEF